MFLFRYECVPSALCPSLPLHFSHLSILSGRYLVCWAPGCLYLFHSASYQLAGWTEALSVEDHVHCDGQNLLVLREGGRAVSILQFTDVSTSVQQLVKLELIQQATQVRMYVWFSQTTYFGTFSSGYSNIRQCTYVGNRSTP